MVKSLRPVSLDEALSYREETGALLFAGGTDLMVKRRGYTGTGPSFEEPVLFLDAIESMKSISLSGAYLCIGGSATLAEIIDFQLLPALLRSSIMDIAAPGLRNRATLGGNICNASPAGDSLPALFVHEAGFVLKSTQGERIVPAGEFFTGPGSTVLADNEILTEIQIPILGRGSTYYRKVGTRKANALSKLSAAGYARKENDQQVDFRFALGAVAPTVIRLSKAEQMVLGGEGRESIMKAASEAIRPIDDQRSTAAYRKQAALNTLDEFLKIIEEE